MMSLIYALSLAILVLVALGRGGFIIAKTLQAFRAPQPNLVKTSSSWGDRLTWPEPFLLVLVTLGLAITHGLQWPSSTGQVVASGVGALFALMGMALIVWSVRSFPTAGPGHYVRPDHQLISHGPYALARHPIYLGAFLIWFGLALGFQSIMTFLMTLLYVIPSYVLYMRDEEKMLRSHMGDVYRDYCERVGMLWPRHYVRG